jgi:hypothetical protein
MAYSTETLAAQQKMQDAEVWFSFFLDPKYRRFNCEANRQIIDGYLSTHGFELNLSTLATAVAALGRKLVEIEPSEQLRRKAAQAQAATQPAPVAPPSNEIPPDIRGKPRLLPIFQARKSRNTHNFS